MKIKIKLKKNNTLLGIFLFSQNKVTNYAPPKAEQRVKNSVHPLDISTRNTVQITSSYPTVTLFSCEKAKKQLTSDHKCSPPRSQASWCLLLALLLTFCVIFDKSLKFSVPLLIPLFQKHWHGT